MRKPRSGGWHQRAGSATRVERKPIRAAGVAASSRADSARIEGSPGFAVPRPIDSADDKLVNEIPGVEGITAVFYDLTHKYHGKIE